MMEFFTAILNAPPLAIFFLVGVFLVVFAIIGWILFPKFFPLKQWQRLSLAAIGIILVGISAAVAASSVNRIDDHTPTPTISNPTATATPTPSVNVTITFPTEGSQVSRMTTVNGTASNIPPGKELWLLIESKAVKGYYPQGGTTGTPSPIVVSSSGTWNRDAYIGQDNDSGRQFVLYIALVDQEGRAAIDRYFASGASSNSYTPIYSLPNGIQILTQVSVIRK